MTDATKPHHGVKLTAEELEKLIVWMDIYAPSAGAYSDQQEMDLLQFRIQMSHLLKSNQPAAAATQPKTSVASRK